MSFEEPQNLSTVCEVIAGQSPRGEFYNKTGEGLAFYQGKKDFGERYINPPTTWTTNITKEARKDDILMSVRAPVGPINFATQKICIGRGLAAIRASNKINKDFLFYFLLKHESEIVGNTGAVFNSINKTQIGEIKTPVPFLEEQKQIVAILDKAFAAIDQAQVNIQQNIQNAQDLFQSKLNQIFSQQDDGWVEMKLGEIGTLTSSKRIFKSEYVNEGIPFYRSKEIKELGHNKEISLELFIAEERYKEIKEKFGVPKKGDILLTAVGTIGEMYIVQNDNEEFYFKDGNIMWLKNFEVLNSYYLKYALTNFVEQLKAISRGAAYSALTIEKLKDYSIPVPSKEDQSNVVEKLNTIKIQQLRTVDLYDKKLNNLEELKKSLLQKAFNGELTQDKQAS